ncbi:hypothetical protein [Gluconobacter oxydans]|uniref:hypothetical protein n=1 Tax=Gluconobacter oxydans TaxID=442 RepID=UPI001CD8742F|nr:hypothetical protein [Gluconobacter oxydans]
MHSCTAAVTAMNHTTGKPGTDNEGSRTPAGRQAILQAEVTKLPKEQRADAAVTLSRLVPFGYKGKTPTGG